MKVGLIVPRLDDDEIARIRKLADGSPVPPCLICDGELSIGSIGGGNTIYRCTDNAGWPSDYDKNDDSENGWAHYNASSTRTGTPGIRPCGCRSPRSKRSRRRSRIRPFPTSAVHRRGMSTSQDRTPKGIPTGGQFTVQIDTDPTISLATATVSDPDVLTNLNRPIAQITLNEDQIRALRRHRDPIGESTKSRGLTGMTIDMSATDSTIHAIRERLNQGS